jgi:hypothetical protein
MALTSALADRPGGSQSPVGCVNREVAVDLQICRTRVRYGGRLYSRLRRPSWMLSRLAYLTLCRSIQLLALLARGDAAKDLEIRSAPPAGRAAPPYPTTQARACRPVVGCVKAFMQLAGTCEAGHQGGRVGAPGLAEPRHPGSDRRMDQAVRAQALGVGNVGCSARHTSGGPDPGDHG